MSLNRIVLIGRLTKDPEMKYTPQGIPVASMGIAVHRFTKNESGDYDVDFFNLVAWRRRGRPSGRPGRKITGHEEADAGGRACRPIGVSDSRRRQRGRGVQSVLGCAYDGGC